MPLTKGLLSQWIHKGSQHLQYIPPVNHAEEKPHGKAFEPYILSLTYS